MKISVGLYPNAHAGELLRLGRLAEELRYARLWVADSHLLWREVWTLLGALAVATSRIGLATAVTNPLTRDPTVTAAAIATLRELAGDRALLGISVGDSALRTLGRKPATLAAFEESVAELRALLAGEAAGSDGRSARLAYPAAEPVPLYVAATGPRMLRLAGRVADGVILMNGVAPELISAAIELVGAGAAEAGRAAPRILVWAAAHACAAAPETSAAAVKYNVARAVLRDVPGMDALARETAARLRSAYDYAQHGAAEARFAALVPDALVPRYAFAGDPDRIAEQVAELARIGVDEVALAVPQMPDPGERERVLRLLAGTLC